MNDLTEIARRNGRDYITPEDVSEAIDATTDRAARVEIWRELLLIMAGYGGAYDLAIGCEDAGLCAFVAVRNDEPVAS